MDYIKFARSELEASRINAREGFCTKRGRLVNLYDVQRELNEMDKQVDESRIRLVRNAVSMLGAADMARLEAQVETTKASMSITKIDKDRAIFALGRTPEDLIAQLCDEMGR